ncbi:hypothetical protein N9Q05_01310 [bacterium]|nr:hypothetical protein [bacterium]
MVRNNDFNDVIARIRKLKAQALDFIKKTTNKSDVAENSLPPIKKQAANQQTTLIKRFYGFFEIDQSITRSSPKNNEKVNPKNKR